MARVPSPEEAVERARQAQEQRLKAIQRLAEARQHIGDVRKDADRERADLEERVAARIKDAERDDLRAYNAALSAGWSTSELRKIGFATPDKKKRAARTNRRTATPVHTSAHGGSDYSDHYGGNSTSDSGDTDHEPVTN